MGIVYVHPPDSVTIHFDPMDRVMIHNVIDSCCYDTCSVPVPNYADRKRMYPPDRQLMRPRKSGWRQTLCVKHKHNVRRASLRTRQAIIDRNSELSGWGETLVRIAEMKP